MDVQSFRHEETLQELNDGNEMVFVLTRMMTQALTVNETTGKQTFQNCQFETRQRREHEKSILRWTSH